MNMGSEYYEDQTIAHEYLLFHYGEEHDFLLNGLGPKDALHFPTRCGRLWQGLEGLKRHRALDLGCAVGGASLELSKAFDEVIGIDFSETLIEAAQALLNSGSLLISKKIEGDLMDEVAIRLPKDSHPERVIFKQGDAMQLPTDIGQFDFLLAANLVDRLPDPANCLKALKSFVSENGRIAVTSPYTWLETFTAKDKWLGGFVSESGEAIRSLDTLTKLFSPEFELEKRLDMPFLIREHERKNQYTFAEATLWRRL